MWPRVVEVMLGMWLMASPFVFRHEPEATQLWWIDLAGGLLIASIAVLTFARRLRRVHLLHLVTAIGLVAHGWSSFPGASSQNHIGVGLMLLMFAIIPSDANQPPPAWREPRQST